MDGGNRRIVCWMDPPICNYWDVWCRMDAHPGQAGWAQAVMSALAVFLAVALQERALRLREREQRKRLFHALSGILAGVQFLVQDLRERLMAEPPGPGRDGFGHLATTDTQRALETLLKDRATRLLALLDMFKLEESPSLDFADVVLDGRLILIRLERAVSVELIEIRSGRKTTNPLVDELDALTSMRKKLNEEQRALTR